MTGPSQIMGKRLGFPSSILMFRGICESMFIVKSWPISRNSVVKETKNYSDS